MGVVYVGKRLSLLLTEFDFTYRVKLNAVLEGKCSAAAHRTQQLVRMDNVAPTSAMGINDPSRVTALQ